MIVNAAIFTCSICGEASVNICSYCTKDACSNHRCERCKRCSDCCECEYPLSAEEPVPVEAVVEAVAETVPGLEPALPQPAEVADEDSTMPAFLTPEESSVFAEETVAREPRIFGESSVFVEEDDPLDDPMDVAPHDETREPRE
jgi:transcription elongation factor Elf1